MGEEEQQKSITLQDGNGKMESSNTKDAAEVIVPSKAQGGTIKGR